MFEDLLSKLPVINSWIDKTIADNKSVARKTKDFDFPSLPNYFSVGLLNNTNVVVVNKIPLPPLSNLGLSEFAGFEQGRYVGITYKDTYFISVGTRYDESTHFHELVHVIQWKHLGADRFLLAYAKNLLEFGYEKSPLELMAYHHQAQFKNKSVGRYDIETAVQQELDNLARNGII